jgi:hypothetical protein
MKRTRYFFLLGAGLILLALVFSFAHAQDDSAPLLTLLSADPAYPVQFQPLTPGDAPSSAAFTSRLDIPADTEQTLIYVILQNTGWSDGTLCLISDTLLADESYVALEVQPGEDGGYVLREGGLAFELEYVEALDGDTPGYCLHVLIAQMQTFAIYPVVDADGLSFSGQTNVRADDVVSQSAVEFMVDPESAFDPIVFDFHIVARPIPAAPVSTPAGETNASGEWGACGSCDTCGHPGECVVSPDGQCVWNPQTCAASASAGGCTKATATCTGGYVDQICPGGSHVLCCLELTDNCGNVYPGLFCPSCP